MGSPVVLLFQQDTQQHDGLGCEIEDLVGRGDLNHLADGGRAYVAGGFEGDTHQLEEEGNPIAKVEDIDI